MAYTKRTFPRTHRLKTPSDFKRVYNSKQWGASPHYTYNVRASDQPHGSLGVTVSKKVSKSAVDRNRIRRQIKEFYRLRQHQLSEADLVITAKPSCLLVSDEDRYASLQELWDKILKWQRWHVRQISNEDRG